MKGQSPNPLSETRPTLCNGVPEQRICLSVVVPAYNEEASLPAFVEAVSRELDKLGESWEIIFVNDGSKDETLHVLQSFREKDARIKIVDFARNFGNQIAVSAGLRFAVGDAVITMDADLQHPPEMIAEMLRLWKEGYHCVYTVRTYDRESGFFKRWSSLLFHRFLNAISDLELPEGLSDFRLLDRRIVDYLNSMNESSRFFRAMIYWLGFRRIGIPFTCNSRAAGTTKFSVARLLKLSFDGMTSFSVKPLHWITYSGIFIATVSFAYALYVLFETFVFGLITPGWPTLIIAILFLGGVQLISLGVVGEYVGRIYMEIKRRPLFVVQEKYGIDLDESTTGNHDSRTAKTFGESQDIPTKGDLFFRTAS